MQRRQRQNNSGTGKRAWPTLTGTMSLDCWLGVSHKHLIVTLLGADNGSQGCGQEKLQLRCISQVHVASIVIALEERQELSFLGGL